MWPHQLFTINEAVALRRKSFPFIKTNDHNIQAQSIDEKTNKIIMKNYQNKLLSSLNKNNYSSSNLLSIDCHYYNQIKRKVYFSHSSYYCSMFILFIQLLLLINTLSISKSLTEAISRRQSIEVLNNQHARPTLPPSITKYYGKIFSYSPTQNKTTPLSSLSNSTTSQAQAQELLIESASSTISYNKMHQKEGIDNSELFSKLLDNSDKNNYDTNNTNSRAQSLINKFAYDTILSLKKNQRENDRRLHCEKILAVAAAAAAAANSLTNQSNRTISLNQTRNSDDLLLSNKHYLSSPSFANNVVQFDAENDSNNEQPPRIITNSSLLPSDENKSPSIIQVNQFAPTKAPPLPPSVVDSSSSNTEENNIDYYNHHNQEYNIDNNDRESTLTTDNLLLILDKKNWTKPELNLLPKRAFNLSIHIDHDEQQDDDDNNNNNNDDGGYGDGYSDGDNQEEKGKNKTRIYKTQNIETLQQSDENEFNKWSRQQQHGVNNVNLNANNSDKQQTGTNTDRLIDYYENQRQMLNNHINSDNNSNNMTAKYRPQVYATLDSFDNLLSNLRQVGFTNQDNSSTAATTTSVANAMLEGDPLGNNKTASKGQNNTNNIISGSNDFAVSYHQTNTGSYYKPNISHKQQQEFTKTLNNNELVDENYYNRDRDNSGYIDFRQYKPIAYISNNNNEGHKVDDEQQTNLLPSTDSLQMFSSNNNNLFGSSSLQQEPSKLDKITDIPKLTNRSSLDNNLDGESVSGLVNPLNNNNKELVTSYRINNRNNIKLEPIVLSSDVRVESGLVLIKNNNDSSSINPDGLISKNLTLSLPSKEKQKEQQSSFDSIDINNKNHLLNKRRLSDSNSNTSDVEKHAYHDDNEPSSISSGEIIEAPLKLGTKTAGHDKNRKVNLILDSKQRDESQTISDSLSSNKNMFRRKIESKLQFAQQQLPAAIATLRIGTTSASTSGIRVTADSSSNRPLIINSRGLITAAKKGSTAYNNIFNKNNFSLFSDGIGINQQKDHLLNPIVIKTASRNKPSSPSVLTGNEVGGLQQQQQQQNNKNRYTFVSNNNNGSTTITNDDDYYSKVNLFDDIAKQQQGGERPTFLKKPLSVSDTIWRQQQQQYDNKSHHHQQFVPFAELSSLQQQHQTSISKTHHNNNHNRTVYHPSSIALPFGVNDLALNSFTSAYNSATSLSPSINNNLVTDNSLVTNSLAANNNKTLLASFFSSPSSATTNSTSFQHNPPYKQQVLDMTTPALFGFTQTSSNNAGQTATTMPITATTTTPYYSHTKRTSPIMTTLSYQGSTTKKPAYHNKIKTKPSYPNEYQHSTTPSADEMNYSTNSAFNATLMPLYEQNVGSSLAGTSSTNDLIAANTNHHKPTISQSLNVFGQQQQQQQQQQQNISHNKTVTKFKYKLQNMLMGKIMGKNHHHQSSAGANNQSLTTQTSAGTTVAPPPYQTTASLMSQQQQQHTPAPLLSSTVANNVASLLAQKLNFLSLVKPLSSLSTHTNNNIHSLNSGFNSLFGVRVGPGSTSASSTTNKLKQRINPFISASSGIGSTAALHSTTAINRRTAGVGSLLFSGFIYGLSVLPALMALTGINPLSDSTTSGSSLTSSLAANRHSNGEKKVTAKHRNKSFDSNNNNPTTSSYAFLVPLITAAGEALEEDHTHHHIDESDLTSAGGLPAPSEPLTISVGQRPSPSILKSLYAPPPTILDPDETSSNELHQFVDDVSFVNTHNNNNNDPESYLNQFQRLRQNYKAKNQYQKLLQQLQQNQSDGSSGSANVAPLSASQNDAVWAPSMPINYQDLNSKSNNNNNNSPRSNRYHRDLGGSSLWLTASESSSSNLSDIRRPFNERLSVDNNHNSHKLENSYYSKDFFGKYRHNQEQQQQKNNNNNNNDQKQQQQQEQSTTGLLSPLVPLFVTTAPLQHQTTTTSNGNNKIDNRYSLTEQSVSYGILADKSGKVTSMPNSLTISTPTTANNNNKNNNDNVQHQPAQSEQVLDNQYSATNSISANPARIITTGNKKSPSNSNYFSKLESARLRQQQAKENQQFQQNFLIKPQQQLDSSSSLDNIAALPTGYSRGGSTFREKDTTTISGSNPELFNSNYNSMLEQQQHETMFSGRANSVSGNHQLVVGNTNSFEPNMQPQRLRRTPISNIVQQKEQHFGQAPANNMLLYDENQANAYSSNSNNNNNNIFSPILIRNQNKLTSTNNNDNNNRELRTELRNSNSFVNAAGDKIQLGYTMNLVPATNNHDDNNALTKNDLHSNDDNNSPNESSSSRQWRAISGPKNNLKYGKNHHTKSSSQIDRVLAGETSPENDWSFLAKSSNSNNNNGFFKREFSDRELAVKMPSSSIFNNDNNAKRKTKKGLISNKGKDLSSSASSFSLQPLIIESLIKKRSKLSNLKDDDNNKSLRDNKLQQVVGGFGKESELLLAHSMAMGSKVLNEPAID